MERNACADTLGPSPGSRLHGNYLHHICNRYGMLYHDSGSEGFTDTANVCVDSPGLWWILINGNGDGDEAYGNFVDSSCKHTYAACASGAEPSRCNPNSNPRATEPKSNCSTAGDEAIAAGGGCHCHCSVHDNTFVSTSADLPPEALAIIAAAGPNAIPAPTPSALKVKLTFEPPVILHGGQNVSFGGWKPGVLVLDGNESMVDEFFALDDKNLFGHCEQAFPIDIPSKLSIYP
jgi:hypothetical protein